MGFAIYKDSQHSVVEHKDGFVKLAPRGGGFISGWISENEVQFVDKFTPEYSVGVAYILDAETPEYPCICDENDRWNGWAKPLFTKEVFDKVVEDANLIITRIEGDTIYGHFHGEEEEMQGGVYQINGETYYDISGWVWDFDKENS